MPLSDNKGIWLVYSKKGNLISKVPNGNVIRQGGTFTLFFVFEEEQNSLNKSLSICFQRPGDKTTTPFDGLGAPVKKRFNKYKPNEITYGLVDGREYMVYESTFDPTYQELTKKYGNLTAIIKIKNLTDGSVYYEGAVQLYVEPTFGKAESGTSYITQTEYENLIDTMNELDIKKLNKKDDVVENLTIESGNISKSVLVNDVENNNVIGELETQEKIDNSIGIAMQGVVRENDIKDYVKIGEFNSFNDNEPALIKAQYADESGVAETANKAICDAKGNIIDETYLTSKFQGIFTIDNKDKSKPVSLSKSGMYIVKKGSYFSGLGNEYSYAEDDCFFMYILETTTHYSENYYCSLSGHIKIETIEDSDAIGREYTYLKFTSAFKNPFTTWLINKYNGGLSKNLEMNISINSLDLTSGSSYSFYAPMELGTEGQILTAGTYSSRSPKWITPPWVTKEQVQRMINEAIANAIQDK